MKKVITKTINEYWEPVSGITHLVAALASLVGLIYLTYLSAKFGSDRHVIANAIFMCSMLMLYTASTVYHIIPLREEVKDIFQRIDHSMIYVLIAGTYTPICLLVLKNYVGTVMLYLMWGVAVVGILIKMLKVELKLWQSLAIYLAMGCLGAVESMTMINTLGLNGFLWIAAGGASYILGVVFFVIESYRDHDKEELFHVIFHIFVMSGSFCHYVVMTKYAIFLK